MWSRRYVIVCFVCLAGVWLGGYGPPADRERLVLSGALLAGLAPIMWLDTVMRWGLRPLRTVPMMGQIFLRSKRGGTLTGVVVLSVCFWLSPFTQEPRPYGYQISAILIFTVAFLWLQPPCALMLGASTRPTGKALASVSAALFPFRVVALLDHRRTGYIVGAFSPFTDNLRTESDHHWRTTVDRLAEHLPLIILDARTDSPIVVSEVRQILDVPSRLKRTMFVVGPAGEAPALRAHGLTHDAPGVRAMLENEIESTLKAWIQVTR